MISFSVSKNHSGYSGENRLEGLGDERECSLGKQAFQVETSASASE